MTKALAIIALAALLLSSQNAFAGGSACSNLSTASTDDLLAIPQIAMTPGPWSPGVKCSSQGLSRAEDTCDEKTTIVRDRMLGHDRRLLIVRSSFTSGKAPLDMDDILIFGCIAGQVKKVFDSFPTYMNGRLKIESAEPNKVILVAPQFPPGTNAGGGMSLTGTKGSSVTGLKGMTTVMSRLLRPTRFPAANSKQQKLRL